MVSAESKKDRRTVEQVQAEIRARKRQKLEVRLLQYHPLDKDYLGQLDNLGKFNFVIFLKAL